MWEWSLSVGSPAARVAGCNKRGDAFRQGNTREQARAKVYAPVAGKYEAGLVC